MLKRTYSKQNLKAYLECKVLFVLDSLPLTRQISTLTNESFGIRFVKQLKLKFVPSTMSCFP